MAIIKKKKQIYTISAPLREYLEHYDRTVDLPITYLELVERYNASIPLYDSRGEDTLWETVFYTEQDMAEIYEALKIIYAKMKVRGDTEVIQHLDVQRVDLCTYGNTRPLRVRIVNRINDNYDHFYIKRADASRVYGLELEDLLSPNRISYMVRGDTLIEEHIQGIPGDLFIKQYLDDPHVNKTRLAKEFIKFNERCFIRLLGDMHSSNYVVDMTPDLEDIYYRIRAIDFDQQCYESRKNVYFPKYFKQNNPIIDIGQKIITPETMRQYQKEEWTLLYHRLKSGLGMLRHLLEVMERDHVAPAAHVQRLRMELGRHYGRNEFLDAANMGQLLRTTLNQVPRLAGEGEELLL